MSLIDLSLNSSAECRMMASLPSSAIWDFESFRSKRVVISFMACWMALETSWRSILLTISKVLSGIESKETALLLDCQAVGSDAAFSQLFGFRSPQPVPMRVTEEALCEQEKMGVG